MGVWIVAEPCMRLDARASHREVGAVLLRALEGSRCGVPHPQAADWLVVSRPLLGLAGVESWAQLLRGALFVDVEDDGHKLHFLPTTNLGRQGFSIDEVLAFSIDACLAAEQLGESLRRALTLSS